MTELNLSVVHSILQRALQLPGVLSPRDRELLPDALWRQAGVCGGQLVQERASVQNVVAVGVGQRAAGSERASLLPVYPCWFRNGKA